jgi:hypothetical protein
MAFSPQLPAPAPARRCAIRTLGAAGQFSVVGLSGYVINLVVYTALLKGAGFTTRPRRRAPSWSR